MEEVDFVGKKKKKRPVNRFELDLNIQPREVVALPKEKTDCQDQDIEKIIQSEPYHDYKWLLARAYGHVITCESDRKRSTLPLPHLQRESVRKTAWMNFNAFCVACNRPPHHLIDYIQAELCASCSSASNGVLIIKAKLGAGQAQQLCRAYVNLHVLCVNCKGVDTLLSRDPESRLTFVKCQVCQAERCVQQTKRKPFIAKVHRKDEAPELELDL